MAQSKEMRILKQAEAVFKRDDNKIAGGRA